MLGWIGIIALFLSPLFVHSDEASSFLRTRNATESNDNRFEISRRLDVGDTIPYKVWTSRNSTYSLWGAMDASPDLSIIVAVQAYGYALKSVDQGYTWTNLGLPEATYDDMTMSDDGNYILVMGRDNPSLSSDGGVTWVTPDTGSFASFEYTAMSEDGQYMFMAKFSNYIFRSADFGATWTQVFVNAGQIRAMACSDSGQYVLIIGTTDALIPYAMQSTDYGATFTNTPRASFISEGCGGTDISMSSSGQYAISNQNLCYSNDYGASWKRGDTSGYNQLPTILMSSAGDLAIVNDLISTNYGANFSNGYNNLADLKHDVYIANSNFTLLCAGTDETGFECTDLLFIQETASPSQAPISTVPTIVPTDAPTERPTEVPSVDPTVSPTYMPSAVPSLEPSAEPSVTPTFMPSAAPTAAPSTTPSQVPTAFPSTPQPSAFPTFMPSVSPTTTPSYLPSASPSAIPSAIPTAVPTVAPSAAPSTIPTHIPTATPSAVPSIIPSATPSVLPTSVPSSKPSSIPTSIPTSVPSARPTSIPSSIPSAWPSVVPSTTPSMQPSARPSTQPSSCPSAEPSGSPSGQPSGQPTSAPTNSPTVDDALLAWQISLIATGSSCCCCCWVYLIVFCWRRRKKNKEEEGQVVPICDDGQPDQEHGVGIADQFVPLFEARADGVLPPVTNMATAPDSIDDAMLFEMQQKQQRVYAPSEQAAVPVANDSLDRENDTTVEL